MGRLSGAFRGEAVAPLWETHGLRLVVRDVGNGVLRLECFELVSVVEAKALAQVSTEIAFPAPGHLKDLAAEAAARLGVAFGDCEMSAYARAVDDAVIEIVASCHA